MSKRLLFILTIAAFLPFEMFADWVPLDKNKSANTPPAVQLISDDNNGTVIKVDISGFDVKEFISNGKSYQAIDLLTDIFSTQAGSPELPQIAKILAIPDQAGISVDILETGEIYTFKDIHVPPARPSWFEGSPEPLYEESAKSYQSNGVYPTEIAVVENPSVFRDFRIARVVISPVRYNPAKKELQVASSITVRINYNSGPAVNPKTSAKRPISPSFARLYRSTIFNYQSVLDNLYGGKEMGHDLMLCIMPDEFVASFQIYADWKRQSGTDIHVTKFSDIGANANNPDIIRNHILDAYNNWEITPTYVLIVGDAGVFPYKIVTYPDYSFPNEDFFVELEGNDYFPEMMIGRFTNQGDYRMQVMINKFLLYEQNPYTANSAWFKKGICCSNNAYVSQVETKRFAAERMINEGGFTSVDTMMSDGNGWGSGCTYHVSDIVSAINNGRSWLNYRGEGWYSGWSASCYGFQASDVSGLSNGEMFTFVTSIGCGVAGFHSSGGNCFGEEWVQLGSLTAPRGACAFIGPTSNTHTTYNNKIDKGIYVGMFPEGLDTPGQALLRGKLYMYNVYGNEYYVEYHYKIYCVLGDPSIHIWKDIPQEVEVDHITATLVGNNLLEITTTYASNSQPVADAVVCVTGNDIFVTDSTDVFGKAYIEVFPDAPETLTVTVRGGHVIPYQGTITVTQPQQQVMPVGAPLIMDTDGNQDGLVNPNEHCNVTFTLKNWGTITANNVQATLTTSDPDFVEILTTTPVSFGNLVPGASFTGSPMQVFVKPNCQVGQEVTIHLQVTSNTSTWEYDQDITVTGCVLMQQQYVVYDNETGNMNFRLDPGETVKIVLSVKNVGEDIAPNVMANLSSSDPYIIIDDSEGSFGNININNVSLNAENSFMLTLDGSCPTGYWPDLSLQLYTVNGNYSYEIISDLNIPAGYPVPADYTGPDAYGYYAYASTDAFYESTPVYNWFEIEGVGNQINVPQLLSDYTETVSLPFTFKYYGVDYNSIRVSTDGWIAFGSGTQVAPVNTGLPNNDNVSSMAAAFWDDLHDPDFLTEGDLFYYHDNTNHRFIVQWDSISHNGFTFDPNREVFQVILIDPAYNNTTTGDGEIIFQYKDIKDHSSNTVGIENQAQNIGLQYVFNENYNPTAATLNNQLAIKFTTQPPCPSLITSIDEGAYPGIVPSAYGLEQNIPNPFDKHTLIHYSLPVKSDVTLMVYNVRGELVRTLQSGQQKAGKYAVEWNGLNDDQLPVSSGIYFYRLQTENYVETMKMFMLK